MSFAVRFTREAEADLARLLDFLLARVKTVDDLLTAERDIESLRHAIEQHLGFMPFSFRKAGKGSRSTRRELVVAQGRTGYVALFAIAAPGLVQVIAVRHQREDDYH
jgi:plasmid stabilization system protein ParE